MNKQIESDGKIFIPYTFDGLEKDFERGLGGSWELISAEIYQCDDGRYINITCDNFEELCGGNCGVCYYRRYILYGIEPFPMEVVLMRKGTIQALWDIVSSKIRPPHDSCG